MANIKDLLSNFKKNLDKNDDEKMLIIKAFKKVLDSDIEKEDISFKNEKLIIKSNPYLKSEIKMNKEKILKEIKKDGIERVLKDVV